MISSEIILAKSTQTNRSILRTAMEGQRDFEQCLSEIAKDSRNHAEGILYLVLI